MSKSLRNWKGYWCKKDKKTKRKKDKARGEWEKGRVGERGKEKCHSEGILLLLKELS
jgi:hypothetical protein